jgi:hypothetical protein
LTQQSPLKIDFEEMPHSTAPPAIQHLDGRQKETIANDGHPLRMVGAKRQLHFICLPPSRIPGQPTKPLGNLAAAGLLRSIRLAQAGEYHPAHQQEGLLGNTISMLASSKRARQCRVLP